MDIKQLCIDIATKEDGNEVIEILKKLNLAKVKGINLVKKHQKATKEKKGGIITKENYINISNLKNLDQKKSEKDIKKKDTKK